MISVTTLFAASLFFTNEPFINMREKASHSSEVVSQTYFSENFSVKKESDSWSEIITSDGYEGWIPTASIVAQAPDFKPDLYTSRLSAHLYKQKDTAYGPLLTVPMGAGLMTLHDSDPRWIEVALPNGTSCFIQRGDVMPLPKLTHKRELVEFSKRFLGLPYTWGGRTSFGYDCSGFIQALYAAIGIDLQRDSNPQINDPRFQTIPISQLEAGDLIFFGKSEQAIRHVGLYIGNNHFIHSTGQENMPWIRISSLTDKVWRGDSDAIYSYRSARQLK